MNNRTFGLRFVLPHLMAIIFVIIGVIDIKIAGLSSSLPLFSLMAIFYFGTLKKSFSLWFVFFLGIWVDALSGHNLGVTSLCYILLIKLFSLFNSKISDIEDFNHIWQRFVLFCFLFLSMKYLILSAFSESFFSLSSLMLQFITSSLSYVLIHKFFDYLYKKILEY
jgi:cell shape-determining protein MreD